MNASDFQVNAPGDVTSATVAADGRTVTLTGTGFDPAGDSVTVAANGITDTEGETNAAQTANIPAAS